MRLTLHVWRQKSASLKGKMVRYAADDINPDSLRCWTLLIGS